MLHFGQRRVLFFLAVLIMLIRPSKGCGGSNGGGSNCQAKDCTMQDWGNWSPCSATCGTSGKKTRTRGIKDPESCGGKCTSPTTEESFCPNKCCPVNCKFSWQSWSPCPVTCGHGNRTRFINIHSLRSCGGKDCPNTVVEKKACGDGR